ncbi:lactonase family protein [Nonomuraea sp. NEAU-A123]|uniref:lactonase family protein n=1 Tax=Nonomuraea sp. NEAU-A123 TaxID=2839649 RepID=UPI001BE3ECE2|nr:lactonase family protein [Nonomuraea sp. NEAU-A123]MBT2225265.1 beta-propeller fold lactonase family protein [Nonomuraea sp. NEAU-A123]
MSDSNEAMTDGTTGPSRRGVLGAVVAASAAAAAVPLLADIPTAEAAAKGTPELLFISTWKGTQIYGARFDSDRGIMALIGPVGEATSNWATMHPTRPVLYVASGEDGGTVYVFTIDRATGALSQSGAVKTDAGGTGGGGLSYIGVDRPSDTLLVANFEAGLAATLPIGKDGGLGSPVSVMKDTGSGPNARQAGPHPHDVVIDPSGRFALVADFGADRVFVYGFDRATRALSSDGMTPYATQAGSGPRRIVFHPNGRTVYLLNELTADIQTLDWNPREGLLTHRQSLSTDTPDYAGTKSAAELAMSRDGRFVYASNRGENTLIVFSVDQKTGLLALVQRTPCGGQKPWSFSIHRSGRWLLVANEASSTVNLFSIDRRSGKLTDTGTSMPIPNPDCITFC